MRARRLVELGAQGRCVGHEQDVRLRAPEQPTGGRGVAEQRPPSERERSASAPRATGRGDAGTSPGGPRANPRCGPSVRRRLRRPRAPTRANTMCWVTYSSNPCTRWTARARRSLGPAACQSPRSMSMSASCAQQRVCIGGALSAANRSAAASCSAAASGSPVMCVAAPLKVHRDRAVRALGRERLQRASRRRTHAACAIAADHGLQHLDDAGQWRAVARGPESLERGSALGVAQRSFAVSDVDRAEGEHGLELGVLGARAAGRSGERGARARQTALR